MKTFAPSILALFIDLWAHALAQQPSDTALTPSEASEQTRAGVVIYDEQFFANFAAGTAEEMLHLVPGIPALLQADDNAQQRGFGSGGARVLLNSRRFPGKDNEVSSQLRRIPATSVARVEVISGAAEGISVQSDGLIVNVVLRDGESLAGTGAVEVTGRFNDEGRLGVDGLVSYTGTWRALQYTLGAEKEIWAPDRFDTVRWWNRTRDETYVAPSGAILEQRPLHYRQSHDIRTYTAGLTYDFARGDRVQVNGFYERLIARFFDETDFTRFDAAGDVAETGTQLRNSQTDPRYVTEVSADYEGRVGPGALNSLLLVRRETGDRTRERATRGPDGGKRFQTHSLSVQEEQEDILRSTYLFRVGSAHSVQLGAEAARNRLEQDLSLFLDTDDDGAVEEIFLPTGVAEVEELRGEVFATHRWSGGARLSLDNTLSYESSRITNNFAFSPDRSLGFVKPRIDARYRTGERTQWRILMERTVSQLYFGNFVPTYDIIDDEIDAGNLGITPEKRWVFELGYERRLEGDGGLIEARAFYNDITDYIDKILLFEEDADAFSAEGNIPSASYYGAELKASLRLAPIGLSNALLSLSGLASQSEVVDPFTGETRRILDDTAYSYTVEFRHDLRSWRSAYGFTLIDDGEPSYETDLFVTEVHDTRPRGEVFVERRLNDALTLRFEAHNVLGGVEKRERTLYSPTILDGDVLRLERFREERDLRMAVRLRGVF